MCKNIFFFITWFCDCCYPKLKLKFNFGLNVQYFILSMSSNNNQQLTPNLNNSKVLAVEVTGVSFYLEQLFLVYDIMINDCMHIYSIEPCVLVQT